MVLSVLFLFFSFPFLFDRHISTLLLDLPKIPRSHDLSASSYTEGFGLDVGVYLDFF